MLSLGRDAAWRARASTERDDLGNRRRATESTTTAAIVGFYTNAAGNTIGFVGTGYPRRASSRDTGPPVTHL
jgi:hypothetical protein